MFRRMGQSGGGNGCRWPDGIAKDAEGLEVAEATSAEHCGPANAVSLHYLSGAARSTSASPAPTMRRRGQYGGACIRHTDAPDVAHWVALSGNPAYPPHHHRLTGG